MPYKSDAQRKAVWASKNEKKKSSFKMKPKSPLTAKISASCKAQAKKKLWLVKKEELQKINLIEFLKL